MFTTAIYGESLIKEINYNNIPLELVFVPATIWCGYEWLDIKTLNTAPLYPSKLRRQIMNLHEGKAYMGYLGNEEIGDPEVTD